MNKLKLYRIWFLCKNFVPERYRHVQTVKLREIGRLLPDSVRTTCSNKLAIQHVIDKVFLLTFQLLRKLYHLMYLGTYGVYIGLSRNVQEARSHAVANN